LSTAFDRARANGFLGDGSLETQIAHAHGFADALESVPGGGERGASPDPRLAGPWIDLGSGGGLPGLVLAHRWSVREAVLLDSNTRRTRFLAEVVEGQGWGDRVRVISARAEEAGRRPDLRGAFSVVVSRSFGPPPVTAECAAPFLCPGGYLIVSEPPAEPGAHPDEDRWPEEGLDELGLESIGLWRHAFGYQILRQVRPCPERYPRRVGVPDKRPLYRIRNR
jgi:16S rRNA (guanine527-N7)-methyltransferase